MQDHTPFKTNGKAAYFLPEDVDKILHAVSSGESKVLNRRRNKKRVNGLCLYESYISCGHNISLVNEIISDPSSEMTSDFIRAILVNIALQFICHKIGIPASGNILIEYLQNRPNIGAFSTLIDDMIGDNNLVSTIDLTSPVFTKNALYVQDEDTLGFIYISLTDIGDRKAAGAYYTPMWVAKKLVAQLMKLTDIAGKSIFDPCCGSGNLLLSVGDHSDTPELLYGQDIDSTAIQLARISFALKFGITDIDFLYSHFVCADTLTSPQRNVFDIIIGNPPWGGEITKEQLSVIHGKYRTIIKKGTETYDLFIECALSLLAESGVLIFVLPEAVLNVAAHAAIRSILIDSCSFKFVSYLGNVFSGVQCPSIILGVQKSGSKAIGISEVSFKNDCYSICSNRQITAEHFNFHVKDELQDCLDAMHRLPEYHTLSGNARFGLGIVTGDNATYISERHDDGLEPILKGRDIKKYSLMTGSNFIRFIPDNFQQVAPTELYRAPAKLFYRFICESLVFAYDDQQKLSLNSCNILIPQIPNMNIKYILAILNSRAANFFFINMFNSVKVLRSHIEQIPIPIASEKKQKEIIALVDSLMSGNTEILKVYNQLDEYIMSLYGLNSSAQEMILSSLNGRNLFLT